MGRPQHLIRELYVFLARDGAEEGVLAEYINGAWFPYVTTDPRLVEAMRPIARRAAEREGKSITLVRFTQREEMEVIR